MINTMDTSQPSSLTQLTEGLTDVMTVSAASQQGNNNSAVDAETSSTATAPSAAGLTRAARILEYPPDFFPLNGGTPKDFSTRWQYRKNRPEDGKSIDKEPHDERAMAREFESLKNSLRSYSHGVYIACLKAEAREHNMTMFPVNKTELFPSNKDDFIKILKTMDDTPENRLLVYKVFHKSFRTRAWLAGVVDQWLLLNKMKISSPKQEEDDNKKKKKVYKDERGGFTTVGRQGKSEAITSFMRPLLDTKGWKIATCYASCESLNYTKEVVQDDGKRIEYWVVRPSGVVSFLLSSSLSSFSSRRLQPFIKPH